MAASMLTRVERLALITQLLPLENGPVAGLSLASLMEKLAAKPGLDVPGKRTLQRDLKEMATDGTIVVLAAEGATPRYARRKDEEGALNEEIWAYLMRQVQQELTGLVSASQLARLFDHLRLPEVLDLDERKLRILPDSLRLKPASINHEVLGTVLRALKAGKALRVRYHSREGQRSDPLLHPQGLLQRGPRVYLYALKNDEETDRMYALDRMVSASMLEQAARAMPGFDLEARVRDGRADFANGEIIRLEALVRGYVEQLLYDCPLDDSQQLTPQEGGGSLLSVDVPASGQLLRWVLAGGDNIVVHGPTAFREVVAGQVSNLHGLYG